MKELLEVFIETHLMYSRGGFLSTQEITEAFLRFEDLDIMQPPATVSSMNTWIKEWLDSTPPTAGRTLLIEVSIVTHLCTHHFVAFA